MQTALITGINGQDGSYLAEFLVGLGYRVIGWIPAHITSPLDYLNSIRDRVQIVEGSLDNQEHLNQIVADFSPDEIYNFASPSSPSDSWKSPVQVGDTAGLGVARLLEAVRLVCPTCRFYQASSSELFGNPVEVPQTESTPFHPRNPYGVAKLFAHWMVVNYREMYGLYTVCGILFNHESPRRGSQFVTRKITREAVRIKLGLTDRLGLGNLDARRDWGFAGDYIEAIYAMLKLDEPCDFVIGTGETHSVREFCQMAFEYLDLDYADYVYVDPKFYRPNEERQLVANPERAMKILNWQPKTSFRELVHLMVQEDLNQLSRNDPKFLKP